jgi:peptide deformylase
MILPIIQYGHPMLRRKGARIDRVTPEIRKLIEDMLETMQSAAGVGLAAQQVGHALQLTVLDVRAVKDRPSSLEINGKPVEITRHMPMVLINPQVNPVGDPATGPEGCLSFPEMYADITRPDSVEVSATNEKGEPIQFRCGGLLARAIQHEVDHLQGILFIDRMTKETRAKLRDELDALQAATKAELKKQQDQ